MLDGALRSRFASATHDEIIVSSQGAVTAYEPETGRELWRCDGQFLRSHSDAGGRPWARVRFFRAVSARRSPFGPAEKETSHARTSRGQARGARLLFRRRSSTATFSTWSTTWRASSPCFEAATGKLMWQGRLGVAQREGFSASPVAVDGKVFFTNDDGETFVLRAGPKFELLRTNRIGEGTLASPALVDGRWYIRTNRSLFAIGRWSAAQVNSPTRPGIVCLRTGGPSPVQQKNDRSARCWPPPSRRATRWS